MPKIENFFESLELHSSFDDLTRLRAYEPLPENWFVGMADIVDSTGLIRAGEYKKINTIGAAVISAQLNSSDDQLFPFVFGGDGASFAFWPEHETVAREGLAAVRRWALSEFGVDLRAAIVPVSAIQEAGFEVSVARYRASEHADYAMFAGGGLSWAEERMKAGEFSVQIAPEGVQPNLEGLSCRWTPMKNENGRMLSLVANPLDGASQSAIAKTMHDIVTLTEKLENSGNPINAEGLKLGWSFEGAELEARATRGTSMLMRRFQAHLLTFLAFFFMKTGLKVGAINPKRYRNVTARNADFRKFDDGLKLTIDCDDATAQSLRRLLEKARSEGIIEFGLVEQESALLTCIVPSVRADNHLHFIDGASGGYAAAAAQIKPG